MQAVLVYPTAKVEAEAEAQARVAANNNGQSLAVLDEEVFVSQLQRRAKILDNGFQSAVLRVVQAFQVVSSSADCPVDNQSLAPVEIGCQCDLVTTDAAYQTSINILPRVQLSSWHKSDAQVAGSSEDDIARQPNRFQRRASSRMLDKHWEEQSSTTCWHGGSSAIPEGLVTLECKFCSGPGKVEVHKAPVKTAGRMLEKLSEYAISREPWPLTACILDPVRASVVCAGPAEMVEAFGWFEGREEQTGLKVVRVKNKFALKKEELVGSYRDLMVCVLYRAANNLAIIGEIQVAAAI